MIIVKEKKNEKGIRMYPFEKSSYEHTRCSLDNAASGKGNRLTTKKGRTQYNINCIGIRLTEKESFAKPKKKSQSLVKRDETIKRRICELYK